jgi:hypothetical protein
VWLAASVVAAQEAYTWREEACPAEYNVSGVVKLPQRVSPDAKAKIVLGYASKDDHDLVTFAGRELKVLRVSGGKSTSLWKTRTLSAAPQHSFVIKRRPHRIAVVVDGELIGSTDDHAAPGGKVGTAMAGGMALDSLRVQEVAPVYFTDDFMRTADQTGAWEPVSGEWKAKPVDSVEPDPTRSANAFSYGVAAKETALATTGYWFWDSYLYRAAVKPEAAGTVGLVAFYQDPSNYALFRWQSRDSAGSTKAQQLVWVRDGKEQVVAAGGTGYQPNQWYELTLKATDSRLEAFVDGKPALTADAPPFCLGKVGLYAKGCEAAVFDDAFCRHWEGPADDPSPFLTAPRITAQFTQEDTMTGWADPESDWLRGQDGWAWNRGVFWEDASLSVDLPFIQERGGSATLTIHATGDDPDSGYALRLTPAATGSTMDCAVSRQGKQLKEKRVATGEWPVRVELRRHRDMLLVEVGNDRLLEVKDSAPLTGTRTAIRTTGLTIPAKNVFATGTNLIDDTFSMAPSRWWQGKGKWYVTSRWSCQPGWTWLAGTESITPVLWSKQAFASDFAVEAFVSNKMDLSGQPGYGHPGDLNVTVCGDGRSLNSGYSCLYAGWNYTESGLFREHEECAPRSKKALVETPTSGNMNFHRHWFRVRVERTGNRLRHLVDDTLLSEYEDPDPIPSGRIALWTFGNEYGNGGMMVARVRLWYEREAEAPDFPSVHWQGEEGGPWDPELPPVPDDIASVKHDFERDLCGWSGYNRRDGAIATVDTTTAASGKQSLKVTNPDSGGDLTVWAGSGAFDALKLPKLRFAYKIPAEVKANLYLQVGSSYYAVEFTGGPQPAGTCAALGKFDNVQADNQWHTAEFDLGAALREARPDTPSIKVNQLCLSAPKGTYYRVGIGGNGWGASYNLDDFELTQ